MTSPAAPRTGARPGTPQAARPHDRPAARAAGRVTAPPEGGPADRPALIEGVDLDAVAVVNKEGSFVGDVTLLKILLTMQTAPESRVSSLLVDEDVVTVRPRASADEVARQLVEARRLSLVVVDDDGRPMGRILADDVLDALVPMKGRFHFPKLLT